MAVKIRLARAGAKGAPYYHIVAADSRSPRDGAYLEKIGSYDPMRKPHVVQLDQERVQYWLKNGAKPSETVASLIKQVQQGETQQAETQQAETQA